MSDIVLSAGIRSNLLALQDTASNIQSTQTRLATGLKVNSALDNPIAYFTASSLNALAGNLGNLLDSVSNAVQTVQAANNGITSITKLVQSAQAIAQQALQSASTTATDVGTVSGLTGSSSFAVTSGSTITISDGTSTATITSTGNVTVNQILNAVNGAAGLKIQAELSANGSLSLEATGANAVTIGGTATAPELAQFGLASGTTAAGSVNSTRSSLATQYNAVLKQIDQLSSDSGFNGVNLLAGNSLQVTFNATGTSSLALSGVTFNSTGLGITQSANNFQTNTSIATRPDAADRVAHHLAEPGGVVRHQPVGHPDPAELHDGDDQHPADRCQQPDCRRQQPGRRQPPGLADPAVAGNDGPVARRPVPEQRVAPVRLIRLHRAFFDGGATAPPFIFCKRFNISRINRPLGLIDHIRREPLGGSGRSTLPVE